MVSRVRRSVADHPRRTPRGPSDASDDTTLYIEPRSPWENGYIESFNGKLRDEFLAQEVFDTLLEAKVLIERWRKTYNTVRPHSSLGYRLPAPESRRPCPPASATPQQADRGDPLAGLPW
jgi:transposase InsO family protein